MGKFFPSPPPPPPPAPATPSRDTAAEEARRRLAEAERRRRGRASTVLTGGQGVLGEALVSRPEAGANAATPTPNPSANRLLGG